MTHTSWNETASAITLGELAYGVHRLETARCRKLLQRIEEQLPPNLPVGQFDALAARRYGKLTALFAMIIIDLLNSRANSIEVGR